MIVNNKVLTKEDFIAYIRKYINDFKSLTEETNDAVETILLIDDKISLTNFVSHYIKPIFKSPGPVSVQYWKSRGWEDCTSIVKRVQEERSPRSIYYWIKRGKSEEEARIEVSNYQRAIGKIGQEKYKDNKNVYNVYDVNNYISKGFTLQEAEEKILKKRLLDKIVQTREYQLLNGKSAEQIDETNRKKVRYNTNNGMYMRSPALTAGSAIAGIYKSKYYFRSTLEFYFILKYENKNIIQCDIPMQISKFIMPLSDGKTYTPDFIIDDILYEIKNSCFLKSEKVTFIRSEMQKINKEIKFITEYDLSEFNITHMEREYNLGNIEFANDKKYLKYLKQKGAFYEKNI